jgi:hypothetical protein
MRTSFAWASSSARLGKREYCEPDFVGVVFRRRLKEGKKEEVEEL